jgi:signal recognition particle subunit SRP54
LPRGKLDGSTLPPGGFASRHGHVLSLIERAQETIDEKQAAQMEERLRKAAFTFDDFLVQMKQVRKMGSLSSIVGMLPGIPGMKQLKNAQVDDKQLDRIEAMVLAMTPEERRHPEIIDGSRRQRIARGSGHAVQDVNALLKQFREMQKMVRQLAGGQDAKFGPGMPF